jgi:hypothetical protein
MTEKTAGPKGNASLPDSFKYFIERLDDEPEHAAHLAEKTAVELANPLHHDHRISGQRFVAGVSFSHVQGKLP